MATVSATRDVTSLWSDFTGDGAISTNALYWQIDTAKDVYIYYGASAPTDGDFSDATPISKFSETSNEIIVIPSGTDNWYLATKGEDTQVKIITDVTF